MSALHDGIYVAGALLALFAIPGLVTAFADRRPLIYMAVAVVLGLAAMGWVWWQDPVAYAPRNLPDAVFRVLGALRQEFR
ncbi:hypothetical protein [Pseudooceanicola sp. HF7]|uniref:hypothetical protein n=1 Tax=Pseudooceanicola sp. HF7 TaxID=2721560 RepID=UPI00143133A4|nr:hypothetical protein [Pseudooceanicola sp. HF7]NIZ11558.1 hypothetical protein [Pseudooceanicola sp. HF7]